MRTRKLGWTDLELSVIGLGTWAIGGGGWKFGWGPQDDEASVRTIWKALDAGINWIDTAAVYGLGHSEEVVGKAIKDLSQRPIIATKCGLTWNEKDEIINCLKKESVKKEAENSLRRLQVEVIDLYQIHWPIPDEQIEEGWEAISELIEEGKVRYGGVSNFSVSQMQRVQKIHPIASLQPPYSMFRREIEKEILPFCASNNVGVIVYSPMQKGLLTGKVNPEWVSKLPPDDHRRNDPMFQEPQLTVNMECVEKLKRIAEKHGKSLSHLAIAWVLRREEVTAAIVGARSPEQIAETALAGDWELDEATISEIETILAEREKGLAALA